MLSGCFTISGNQSSHVEIPVRFAVPLLCNHLSDDDSPSDLSIYLLKNTVIRKSPLRTHPNRFLDEPTGYPRHGGFVSPSDMIRTTFLDLWKVYRLYNLSLTRRISSKPTATSDYELYHRRIEPIPHDGQRTPAYLHRHQRKF
jgi:hypothetical protein